MYCRLRWSENATDEALSCLITRANTAPSDCLCRPQSAITPGLFTLHGTLWNFRFKEPHP